MKYQFIIFILLPLSLWANDPQYDVRFIPAELIENANAVIRQSETRFVVESPGTATEYRKMIVTRFNDRAGYDQLYIPYDMNSTIKGKVKVNLYDRSGNTIRKLGKDEFVDRAAVDDVSLYTDSRYLHGDLTYGTYPYTIEYEYTIQHKGIQSYPSWYVQSYATSVQQAHYVLLLPNEMKFYQKQFNFEPTEVVQREGTGNKHTWMVSNLPAIKHEAYAPGAIKILPLMLVAPEQFEVEGYRGSMRDWSSFGKFMHELNEGRDELSPRMQRTVLGLVENVQTDEEKVAILYKYLQENMRYVSVQLGIGGWQTYDAEYVENNKYGDCKALTNFMKGMLKVADIEAYPALVTADERDYLPTEDFTYPMFNHVILNVPSTNTWLECTSHTAPFGYLGSFTEDRPVLVYNETGGVLMRTPAIPDADNHVQHHTRIELAEDGSATIQNTMKYTGIPHETFRQVQAAEWSETDLRDWFVDYAELPVGKLRDLTMTVSETEPRATLTYQLDVNRFGSKAGKRMFVPLNALHALERQLPPDDDRTQPIQIHTGYVVTDTVVLQLPVGITVESMPDATQQISTEFGTYEYEIVKHGDALHYHRRLHLQPVDITSERYAALRDFYNDIARQDKAKLVLKVGKT